jgi:hypothetical protein
VRQYDHGFDPGSKQRATFCPFSINEITTFITNNSGCLRHGACSQPNDKTDFFVRQHYTIFLGRPADQQGLNFGVAKLRIAELTPAVSKLSA